MWTVNILGMVRRECKEDSIGFWSEVVGSCVVRLGEYITESVSQIKCKILNFIVYHMHYLFSPFGPCATR